MKIRIPIRLKGDKTNLFNRVVDGYYDKFKERDQDITCVYSVNVSTFDYNTIFSVSAFFELKSSSEIDKQNLINEFEKFRDLIVWT